MSPQRYEAVSDSGICFAQLVPLLTMIIQVNSDDDDNDSPIIPISNAHIPTSPPPSFHSRASSPATRRLLGQDPLESDVERTLADTFDDGEASDNEDGSDDRQRVMRANPQALNNGTQSNSGEREPHIQRRVTELPVFSPPRSQNRIATRSTNDGVFANLEAKSESGEVIDEKPPVSRLDSQMSLFQS